MAQFFPNAAANLNKNGDFYNDLLYVSNRTGNKLEVTVGIEKQQRRLPSGESHWEIALEDVFVRPPGFPSSGVPRVEPPSLTSPAVRGANILSKVLSDMEAYARSRGLAGIAVTKIANPLVLASLLRRGFTSGSAVFDGELQRLLAGKNLSTNRNWTPVFERLQKVKGPDGNMVGLYKLL